MSDRVVIARHAGCLLAFPFENVDEILGIERIISREQLGEDAIPDGEVGEFYVFSRSRWLALGELIENQTPGEGAQILVLQDGDARKAYIVDQVVGLERLGKPLPMPQVTDDYLSRKYSGVHIWKNQVVLELDLSSLV